MFKKKSKQFKLEKGRVLLFKELNGALLLSWHYIDSFERCNWPSGDDRILIEFLQTDQDIRLFAIALHLMFGVVIRDVTEKYTGVIRAFEIF